MAATDFPTKKKILMLSLMVAAGITNMHNDLLIIGILWKS